MKYISSERRRRVSIGAACAVILLLAGIGLGADEVPDVDLNIERVALFKNGLGYFTSFATLPKGATTVKINQLPIPSHGTFWVSYPEDVKVGALFTSKGKKEVEGTTPARSIADLLRFNSGREVTVFTTSKEVSAIKGTVVDIISGTLPAESSNAYSMDMRSSSLAIRNPSYQTSSLIVVKTEEGTVALNAGSISRVDFEGDDITTSVPNKSTIMTPPSIRIELEKAAKGQEIGISYLARGITWSPSYLIDISDSTTARLSAKAVVINEVADLKEIQLDLVTGFPNIQFGDVNSPVAMSEDLAGFLRALVSGRSESSGRDNVMMQQRMLSNVMVRAERVGEMDMPTPEYSTAVEGSVSEDLFLYPVESFTLLRDETATIPLFTAEVSYKHVYIW
jgi:hypothetical protein